MISRTKKETEYLAKLEIKDNKRHNEVKEVVDSNPLIKQYFLQGLKKIAEGEYENGVALINQSRSLFFSKIHQHHKRGGEMADTVICMNLILEEIFKENSLSADEVDKVLSFINDPKIDADPKKREKFDGVFCVQSKTSSALPALFGEMQSIMEDKYGKGKIEGKHVQNESYHNFMKSAVDAEQILSGFESYFGEISKNKKNGPNEKIAKRLILTLYRKSKPHEYIQSIAKQIDMIPATNSNMTKAKNFLIPFLEKGIKAFHEMEEVIKNSPNECDVGFSNIIKDLAKECPSEVISSVKDHVIHEGNAPTKKNGINFFRFIRKFNTFFGDSSVWKKMLKKFSYAERLAKFKSSLSEEIDSDNKLSDAAIDRVFKLLDKGDKFSLNEAERITKSLERLAKFPPEDIKDPVVYKERVKDIIYRNAKFNKKHKINNQDVDGFLNRYPSQSNSLNGGLVRRISNNRKSSNKDEALQGDNRKSNPVILKGNFNKEEREIVRDAWDDDLSNIPVKIVESMLPTNQFYLDKNSQTPKSIGWVLNTDDMACSSSIIKDKNGDIYAKISLRNISFKAISPAEGEYKLSKRSTVNVLLKLDRSKSSTQSGSKFKVKQVTIDSDNKKDLNILNGAVSGLKFHPPVNDEAESDKNIPHNHRNEVASLINKKIKLQKKLSKQILSKDIRSAKKTQRELNSVARRIDMAIRVNSRNKKITDLDMDENNESRTINTTTSSMKDSNAYFHHYDKKKIKKTNNSEASNIKNQVEIIKDKLSILIEKGAGGKYKNLGLTKKQYQDLVKLNKLMTNLSRQYKTNETNEDNTQDVVGKIDLLNDIKGRYVEFAKTFHKKSSNSLFSSSNRYVLDKNPELEEIGMRMRSMNDSADFLLKNNYDKVVLNLGTFQM